jgi:CheY-like chemotaxis protein
MLRVLLELLGHDVHDTADGSEGVERALTLRPDIAIVDVGLPGLDGYEVARRIRAAGARGPLLVALTGRADRGSGALPRGRVRCTPDEAGRPDGAHRAGGRGGPALTHRERARITKATTSAASMWATGPCTRVTTRSVGARLSLRPGGASGAGAGYWSRGAGIRFPVRGRAGGAPSWRGRRS